MKLTKRLLIVLILCLAVLAATPGWSEDNSLQQVKELKQEGLRLYKQGKYAESIVYAEKVLAIHEKTLGQKHPDTVQSLSSLGVLYMYMGTYGKAEPLLERALAMYEKFLGQDHPHTATALNNLAGLYYTMGAYQKAEPLLKRSLVINEKLLGPDHPNTALSLDGLAELYQVMGSYDKAEPFYKRSLTIRETLLGSEHPDTANSLNSLGVLYDKMGAYDKAEPLYQRSLAIREKVLGPEHPDTATSLNGLAGLYRATGAYDKAAPLYKRALAMYEKTMGSDHPHTATALNNLAGLYSTMGSYDKAEPLYLRALSIYEKTLGPEHPHTTNSLNSLALLYGEMGAYGKAELLYNRSLAIDEKTLGPAHPRTANSLNSLALLYMHMGAYDKAEPLYQSSLAIREKVLGAAHPSTAQSLNNLAGLYDTMGDYNKAEPLFLLSLAIKEKVLGPEHPDTAATLNNLAVLYMHMGAYDKAETLYKRALAICEKVLGVEHHNTVILLNRLAGLYAVQGRDSNALALMERTQLIDKKQIDQILGFASEAQQTQFLSTLAGNLIAYLSLIHQRFPNNHKAVRNALDVWLARKGILLEAQKRIQDVLAGEDNTKAREIFADLSRVRQELAGLVLGGPGKEGPQAYQKRITELTTQKETLEGQLSRLSQFFARQRKTRIATISAIAAALPKDAVLVEMARIWDFDFKADKWGAPRYIAFVLSPGTSTEVSLVDLGAADSIDQKVAAFKKSLGNSKTPSDVLAKESKSLYKIIFAPLTSALSKSRQIFLSPDGSLNLIPFEVLQDDQGRYLVETHTFHYVSAGRDIAGYGMVKEKGQKAILMGDPDFDMIAGKTSPDKEIKVALSRNMQGINFSRLPGTKEEVEAISSILGRSAGTTYTGKAATESVLTQMKSPRILHLATHGFFLSDQDWSSMMDEKSRGIAIIGKDKSATKKPLRIENPFLRAGLALSGANNSLSQEGATEGILTAEKILGLNLRGTDMVVLSACETGMGDVKNGEGVYGLRRAFTQAGAKSLVMSMWEVPDRETKELMVSFYKNLQSGKMNRAEALRNAALQQRQTVKTRYGKDNPYYWGAFVFLGEADPVASKTSPADDLVNQKQLHIEEVERLAKSPFQSTTDESTDIALVFVRGGCYKMGDTFGDGYGNEKPVHKVCLRDFYIGKHEITQGQWQKVMGNNPSSFKDCGNACPVENVTWYDTQEFINKLNSQSGKKYRLPTEAEWEYASRSAGKAEKWAGTSNESSLGDYAWYSGNSGSKTHPVEQKKSNSLGIYDMSGNVWEWCSDRYGDNYYGESPRNNPLGTDKNYISHRVARGGGWNDNALHSRTAVRVGNRPNYPNHRLGFRVAVSTDDI